MSAVVAGSDGTRGMFYGDVVRATVVDDKTLCGWPPWTLVAFVDIKNTCAPAHTIFRDVRRIRRRVKPFEKPRRKKN